MKHLKYFILLAAISVLAAAQVLKVTSSWKSPDVSSSNLSMKKIMVAALLPDRNRELQKSMEKQLVDELEIKRNRCSFSITKSMALNIFRQDEHKAVNKLQESGVDGFLTIVLLDKTKQKSYNPGYAQFAPVGYYRSWFGYYRTVYGQVYTPGYYTTQKKYYWESNLYSLPDEKLIYSAQSQSFDPSSISKLASDYSDKLVNDMTKQGLVAKV